MDLSSALGIAFPLAPATEKSSESDGSCASTHATSPESNTLTFDSCVSRRINRDQWLGFDERKVPLASLPSAIRTFTHPLGSSIEQCAEREPLGSPHATTFSAAPQQTPSYFAPPSWAQPPSENPHRGLGSTSWPYLPPPLVSPSPFPSFIPAAPPNNQQPVGHAYVLDRGNGKYTRLIPADMLPPLRDVPRYQPVSTGLVVLQPLLGPAPPGVPDNNTEAAWKYAPETPERPSDSIQKHIDTIIMSTPTISKKNKIYCDKWIHDGVCAFTQQGCKFKHEMPMDKATQHQLGLFHGLPAWWKRQAAEVNRQQRDMLFASLPTHLSPATSITEASSYTSCLHGRGVIPPPLGPSPAANWPRTESLGPPPSTSFLMSDLSGGGGGGGGGFVSTLPVSGPPSSRYVQSRYASGPALPFVSNMSNMSNTVMPHHSISTPPPSSQSSCVWGPIAPPSKHPQRRGRELDDMLS